MLSIEGQTRTCQVVLGGIVEVIFPSKMNVPSLGRYRVVEVVHKVDKSGNYSNHFVGTPENREFITQRYLGSVKAYPEMAVVSSNSDPKGLGRVQVQFDWQKRTGKNTNWIRVQTPDAGGSGMANRGLVFIPEEGDQVRVGFEFGDPNRPYVMGSVFSGKTGKGGGEGNNIHSIVTKSGRQIILNDANDGGIVITDDKGNSIELSVAGSSITITAPEEILLQSKNIRLEADENVTVIAGKDYDRKVKENSSVVVNGDNSVSVKGNNKEQYDGDWDSVVKGNKDITIKKECSITVSGSLTETVDKDSNIEVAGKLTYDISKDGKIKSNSKMYVIGGGSVYIGK